VCLGQDIGDEVVIAVIRRPGLLERRALIKFRVQRGEIAAMKIRVLFLLAMVRQRLPRHLPAADSASVGERRQEQGVHRSALLQNIQHLLGALIEK
jgi:hypothetical protein